MREGEGQGGILWEGACILGHLRACEWSILVFEHLANSGFDHMHATELIAF